MADNPTSPQNANEDEWVVEENTVHLVHKSVRSVNRGDTLRVDSHGRHTRRLQRGDLAFILLWVKTLFFFFEKKTFLVTCMNKNVMKMNFYSGQLQLSW